MNKITKKIIIENAEHIEKIKNVISSQGDLNFVAESDDGRDIIYDISINNKNITDNYLKETICDIHWNHLDAQEGSGVFVMNDDKIYLIWRLELNRHSFEDINNIFFEELADILSIPKEWDISWLIKCYFDFEGEMNNENEIYFQKFIFSLHLYDYKEFIEDISKKDLKIFEMGYIFHPDENFQIEMRKLISKLISRTGIKENTFKICGDNSLSIFSVCPNESETFELSLN